MMRNGPIKPSDLTKSVIAVPPLARSANGRIDRTENARIMAYARRGGVSTFLYGGNANVYHLPASEFGELLGVIADGAADDDLVIPAIGSDYGKAWDQVGVLRSAGFACALLLPQPAVTTDSGLATGIRRLADRLGYPISIYLREERYLSVTSIAKLFEDGAVSSVKYAVGRPNPVGDSYLEGLLHAVGPSRIVSGSGERPVLVHLGKYGLAGFTSGLVCIAPRLSTKLFKALQRGDTVSAQQILSEFLPLEDLRDAASPIRTLHFAVGCAGIAKTGPLMPFLSDIEDRDIIPAIEAATRALLASEANAAKD